MVAQVNQVVMFRFLTALFYSYLSPPYRPLFLMAEAFRSHLQHRTWNRCGNNECKNLCPISAARPRNLPRQDPEHDQWKQSSTNRQHQRFEEAQRGPGCKVRMRAFVWTWLTLKVAQGIKIINIITSGCRNKTCRGVNSHDSHKHPQYISWWAPPGLLVSVRLMNTAFVELIAFQRSLKELVATVDATYAKQHEEFYVGLEGSFGSKHVTPRTLTSRLLGSMVCVEGIITKCKFYYCDVWRESLKGGGRRIVANKSLFLCRFAGSSQSGAQRPLLSNYTEDHGKKIHRHDITGCLPLQFCLSHQGQLQWLSIIVCCQPSCLFSTSTGVKMANEGIL